MLIDILNEEVPEPREWFTEWFASYLAGQGLDVAVGQPIRDLQEVKAMLATKFQEYSRRLKEEGREEGLSEGLEQGLEQGRTEGRTAERLAIARRLLGRGDAIKDVAELTDLSPEDVAVLAKGVRSFLRHSISATGLSPRRRPAQDERSRAGPPLVVFVPPALNRGPVDRTGESHEHIRALNRLEYARDIAADHGGMRDHPIGDSFGVDYAIVWDVATTKLRPLQFQIQSLVEFTERSQQVA